MATVTGYTAAYQDQLNDANITDARLDGTDLILIQRDLTEINVGDVQGIQGIQGPAGPGNPAGTMLMFAGAVLPSGYFWCDGASYDPAVEVDLFAAIGTTYGGDGVTTFFVPNMGDRVGLGADTIGALGDTGGSKDATLVQHTHTGPSHTHTYSSTASGGGHSHTVSGSTNSDSHTHAVSGTTSSDSHSHTVSGTTASDTHSHTTQNAGGHAHLNNRQIMQFTGIGSINVGSGGYSGVQWGTFSTDSVGDHKHTVNNDTHSHTFSATTASDSHTHTWSDTSSSDSHSHTVSGTAASTTHSHTVSGTTDSGGTGNTGSAGVPGTDKNLPPYLAVNYIIKN